MFELNTFVYYPPICKLIKLERSISLLGSIT